MKVDKMKTRQVQDLLDYLGYDPGPVDGLDGAQTELEDERF